jgi:hypothetical protein
VLTKALVARKAEVETCGESFAEAPPRGRRKLPSPSSFYRSPVLQGDGGRSWSYIFLDSDECVNTTPNVVFIDGAIHAGSGFEDPQPYLSLLIKTA